MTNANPLILLRNNAIMWVSITVLTLFATWWMYGVFSSAGADTLEKVDKLNNTLILMREE